MNRIKKVAFIAALLSIGIVIGVTFLVGEIRKTVRDAYACEWVAGEIIAHMESHEGAWPRSWDDLRPIHDRYVSEGKCPWEFEMLQDRVAVNWEADPKRLTSTPEGSNSPPFHVISLKNGKQTHWRNMEPNGMIHKWLIRNQKLELDQACNNPTASIGLRLATAHAGASLFR